ncbi:hypothetical protein GUJ93_ZPchr0001g32396 [Zizania palustris]|uniref:Uncharacterized protein n=1 Tax=Zizania palustris TaxID=103762 RepID=A0A8J5SBK9_ZIZPA|nr:hypothetical protein GUJ93_ZPchr0001g32396 [Zizania palustris]
MHPRNQLSSPGSMCPRNRLPSPGSTCPHSGSSSGSTHPRNRLPSPGSTCPYSGSELWLDAPSPSASELRLERAPARRTLTIGLYNERVSKKLHLRVRLAGRGRRFRGSRRTPGAKRLLQPGLDRFRALSLPNHLEHPPRLIQRRARRLEVIPHESDRMRARRRRKRKPRCFDMSENPVSSHLSRHLAVLRYGKVYLLDDGLDKFHLANQGLSGDVERATSGAVVHQHLLEGHRSVRRRLPRLSKSLGYLPVSGGKVHLDPLKLGHSGPEGLGISRRLPEFVHLRDLSPERGNLLFEPLRFCGPGPKPLCLGSSSPKGVDFRLQLVGSCGSSPEPFQLRDAGLEGVHLRHSGLERFDPCCLEPKGFDLHCSLAGQPLRGIRSGRKPRGICLPALALGEQGNQRTLRQHDYLRARKIVRRRARGSLKGTPRKYLARCSLDGPAKIQPV